MKKNIGTIDKVVRFLLALIFAYIGYVYSYWFFVLSIGLLITIITGICMPYRIFGFSSK